MGDYDLYDPKAFEEGAYYCELFGHYGVTIGVAINPMHSILVQIALGWQKYRKMRRTEVWIRVDFDVCRIFLEENPFDESYPDLHNKGIATCAVNTAISFLLPFYKKPESTILYGEVSDIDDQRIPEELRPASAEKRRNFWKRFGFSGSNHISCRLSELKYVTEGLMLDEFPRLIPLEQFRRDPEHTNMHNLFPLERGFDIREIFPKSNENNKRCALF
jgi:hypothetical protein